MTTLHGPAHDGDTRPTVLHVILSLEIGGMEQVVADLVENLDKNRFNVVVVCLNSLGPIADELMTKGITVIQLPRMIRTFSFLYPAALVRIMRETRASLVHVHSGCLYKAVIAAKFSGIETIIYTEHGRQYPERNSVMFFDRLFSRSLTRVVAVSRELAHQLHTEVGMPRERIEVVRNGIRVGDFISSPLESSGDDVVIGVIARLAAVKDIPTLLQAMDIVLQTESKVRLQIVGDGPERASLEALSVKLGLQNHVTFFGFRRDIPALLSRFDIFVLTSLSEGTSVTILEAMAAGKPVVVTGVGGNPSLVEDKRNGFLVPPRRPDQLAEAVLMLLRNPSMRRSMGKENRRKALDEFSIGTMVSRYEELYLSALCSTLPHRAIVKEL